MATIYNIEIKTVSPFCAYDEAYITEMFKRFLKDYKDPDNNLGFEATVITVEKF